MGLLSCVLLNNEVTDSVYFLYVRFEKSLFQNGEPLKLCKLRANTAPPSVCFRRNATQWNSAGCTVKIKKHLLFQEPFSVSLPIIPTEICMPGKTQNGLCTIT